MVENNHGKQIEVYDLTWFGLLVTFLYIALLLIIRWPINIILLSQVSLGELGSFLSGVFGPLMLFWVILGYWQQKTELKQNTEVLRLQYEELEKTVSAQNKLVESADRQLKIENQKFQPVLIPVICRYFNENGKIKHNLVIQFTNRKAYHLKISADPNIQFNCSTYIENVEIDQKVPIDWIDESIEKSPNKLSLYFSYLNKEGFNYLVKINLLLLPKQFEYIVEKKNLIWIEN